MTGIVVTCQSGVQPNRERWTLYLEDIPGCLPAKDILLRYLDRTSFTGAVFDLYGAARTDPMVITADDLLAVTMLSIEIRLNSPRGIPAGSILEIEQRRDAICEILHDLGPDRELQRLSAEEFEQYIGSTDSPANRLYWLLRKDEGCGVKPIATYKLLARKRPHLLPIRDSVLSKALFNRDRGWWRAWWEVLTTRPELVERLRQIRAEAGARASHLSLLRVADILIWVRQHGADQVPGLRHQVGPALDVGSNP